MVAAFAIVANDVLIHLLFWRRFIAQALEECFMICSQLRAFLAKLRQVIHDAAIKLLHSCLKVLDGLVITPAVDDLSLRATDEDEEAPVRSLCTFFLYLSVRISSGASFR